MIIQQPQIDQITTSTGTLSLGANHLHTTGTGYFKTIQVTSTGITNGSIVKIDSAIVANSDYARFTAKGLEGRTVAEIASDIGAVLSGTTKVKDCGDANYTILNGDGYGLVTFTPYSDRLCDLPACASNVGRKIKIRNLGGAITDDWYLPSKDELNEMYTALAMHLTGFNDWYLPSKGELALIYSNLAVTGISNFEPAGYWSSSEYDATSAWAVEFGNNGAAYFQNKSNQFYNRPCRSFTSVSPSYIVGDVGPAGGWIFYKSGNNYLEAFAYDLSAQQWSNIVDTTVTGTSTAVGTGQANTTAIMGQAGHTNSSAKSCNDLLGYSKLGNFDDQGGYITLSSSEIDASTVWGQDYADGWDGAWNEIPKLNSNGIIRPCRSFTSTTIYAIGSRGPKGGWVFYKSGSNYLECADEDLPGLYSWSDLYQTEVGAGAQGTAIGTGQANTLAIVNQQVIHDDWYLPSKDELALMYTLWTNSGYGNFKITNIYWSSSENSAIDVWVQDFVTETQASNQSKINKYHVRPCRSFTDVVNSWSVSQRGPSGGWIIYSGEGNSYIECAPEDLDDFIWSNVIDVAVTGTGTNIGSGQANTTLIIGQTDHVISAAKECDDYTFVFAPNSAAKICNDLVYRALTEKVSVIPNGTDTINGFNSNVDITEVNGEWEFISTSTGWDGVTDGNSTKVELISITSSPSNILNYWSRFTPSLEITLPVGIWRVDYDISVSFTAMGAGSISIELTLSSRDVENITILREDEIKLLTDWFDNYAPALTFVQKSIPLLKSAVLKVTTPTTYYLTGLVNIPLVICNGATPTRISAWRLS